MKTIKTPMLMLIFLISIISSCIVYRTDTTLQILMPQKFDQHLKKEKGILIDVRTTEEFNGERIPGAINLDFQGCDFISKIELLDRDRSYFLYCYGGKRSGLARVLMIEKGFKKVYSLKGGITAWKYEEMPIESGLAFTIQ